MGSNHAPARLAFFGFITIFIAAIAPALNAQAMSTVTMVEGAISSISGDTITLTLANGIPKAVALQPATLILRRQPAALGDIKPGDALGVASRRGSDGSLVAVGINVFSPELYSAVRKGEFPMTTGDTMTNALVTTYAKGVQGRVLTMTYAEGTSTIGVPDGTPIRRTLTVKATDLAVGLRVQVRGTVSPDGSLKASTVSFELPAKG
jgi:hypothetical protein